MKKINNKIRYFFDKDADILYFTKKKPSAQDISRELSEGVVVRIDAQTRKVIGFTILNFLKRQMKNSITLPLFAEFEMAR